MIDTYIAALADYAVSKKLIEPLDRTWAINRLLPPLGLSAYEEPAAVPNLSLEEILTALTQYAVEQGLAASDVTSRDLFDTELMGRLTPRPSQVYRTFSEQYTVSPKAATDWYYRFSQDTDYIRRYRIAKDQKWVSPTPIRRSGHHHQSLQAGEGPPCYRRRQDGASERLSQVPALPGERGVRRAARPPRPCRTTASFPS